MPFQFLCVTRLFGLRHHDDRADKMGVRLICSRNHYGYDEATVNAQRFSNFAFQQHIYKRTLSPTSKWLLLAVVYINRIPVARGSVSSIGTTPPAFLPREVIYENSFGVCRFDELLLVTSSKMF